MSIIDEYLASCVLLPPDVCPFSGADDPRFLVVIGAGRQPPATFGDGIPFFAAFEVMSRVCRYRAPLTVDQQLLVKGRVISPEAYLRRWRDALHTPTPIRAVTKSLGLRPVAMLSWRHDPILADTKPFWVHAPYPRLGHLLDAHAQELRLEDRDGAVRAALEIDLTRPNGARDAWWCADFVSHGRRGAIGRVAIEWRKHDGAAHQASDQSPDLRFASTRGGADSSAIESLEGVNP